jgi:hypothetical protein
MHLNEIHPRDSLNRHYVIGIVSSVVVIVACILSLAWWQSTRQAQMARAVERVYYTTDDGKTLFVDAVGKACPFDHEGEQAYRAYVFRCGNTGKLFTAYVEQLDEGARARVAELSATTQPARRDEIERVIQEGRLVRRPGETEWVKAQSEQGEAITAPTCADGEVKNLQPVFPG